MAQSTLDEIVRQQRIWQRISLFATIATLLFLVFALSGSAWFLVGCLFSVPLYSLASQMANTWKDEYVVRMKELMPDE